MISCIKTFVGIFSSSRFILQCLLSYLPGVVSVSSMTEDMLYGEGSGLDVVHVGDLLDYLGKAIHLLDYLGVFILT